MSRHKPYPINAVAYSIVLPEETFTSRLLVKDVKSVCGILREQLILDGVLKPLSAGEIARCGLLQGNWEYIDLDRIYFMEDFILLYDANL